MTTDTLPATVTRAAAVAVPTTGEVIDHTKVIKHRDWRQIASEWVGLAAAFAGAAAVGGFATNTLIDLSKVAAVVAGALVGIAMLLVAEVAREGRKWVYADTDEPHPNDPANTP
ncbi:hypothetical protein GCM10011608_10270 [Micromonospora sonchi]|uniref:Uncharacterized protein n=1 Tax=Micromonospora sonchi TaxID=1763543 RepID=A0A917WTU4_9ACTN|nr:hypothetical protein [Micromonospora sonchi]GGM27449.1 hypothetical protein GCM10011608_10270 [Micromonospora sonchi]